MTRFRLQLTLSFHASYLTSHPPFRAIVMTYGHGIVDPRRRRRVGKLFDQLTVFGGNANPALTTEICEYIGLPKGRAEVFKFSNDNTFVRIGESVRQNDVYVVQSCTTPVNDAIMELLIMIDTLTRASAGRVTAVIPYYGYGRTDKKDQPRVPITARLVAKLIVQAGADRVLTVDLHAGQIQGFFDIPVDEMSAMSLA